MMAVHMILVYFLFLAKVSNTVRAPASSTFLHMAVKKMYVDKTELLIDFISDNVDYAVYLSAPRRFGKTTNNQMIATFFNIEFKEDGHSLITDKKEHPLYEKFKTEMKDLKVVQNVEFFNKHFGNYIVVYIELGVRIGRALSEIHIKKKLISRIWGSIFDPFHQWWFNSGSKAKIYKTSRRCYRILTQIFEESYDDALDWIDAIKCLFINLRQHYNKEVILLVDEFDYSILQALRELSSESAKTILKFLSHIFGSLTKDISTQRGQGQYEYPVFRLLLTGITHLPIGTGSSRLNNVKVYNYFTKHQLSKYYGFCQNEVDVLLKHYNYLEMKEDVKNYYDGYKVINAEWQNYNPLSIIEFIKEGGKIQSYWRQTGSVSYWFQFCTDPEIFQKIELLAVGKPAFLDILTTDTVDNLEIMKEVLDICESLIWKKQLDMDGKTVQLSVQIKGIHRKHFFKYLLQEGYLSPADSSMETHQYVAPNEEVRQEFEQIYLQYVDMLLGVNFKSVANVFWDLAEKCSVKYEHKEVLSENIHRLIQNKIDCVDDFHYNEQSLRSMVFVSCMNRVITPDRKEFVFGEVTIEVQNFIHLMQSNGAITHQTLETKKSGRADVYLKLLGGKTILIVEFKCTSNPENVKSQVLGYRPRKEDQAKCEKLVLVWLTMPRCPDRRDNTGLQKRVDEKLEVTLGCYFIENYNSNLMKPVARECIPSLPAYRPEEKQIGIDTQSGIKIKKPLRF